MENEKIYNEAVDGDEGFTSGDAYPSCEGQPCANVADETGGATDTMADASAAEPSADDEHAAEIARWQDKYLRLQAEFDNYRKRTLREKMDLVQTGGRDVLLAMLAEALRQRGVTEIEVAGKEFDPDLSEAVARFAAGEEMKGRVVDTVQTGYMLGEKVLRFAKVVVGE